MTTMNNPFIISGYAGPEYFCDREEETKRVIEAIHNNRNMLILSLRRMGKTGLIHHVYRELGQNKNIALIYLDIMHCQRLGDFVNELGKAVLHRLDKPGSRYYQKTMKFLSGLRPRMTFDPVSGVPAFDFRMQDQAEEQATLDQIMSFLGRIDKKVVLSLDEFQQVSNFPEKGTEALLRGRFQSLPHIQFVFSGSRRQMLLSMFQQEKRPFYQSAEILHLDSISKSSYSRFILRHFSKRGSVVEQEALESILDITRNHTWFTQFLCNRIYEAGHKIIGPKTVDQHLLRILDENEPLYEPYLNLLARSQADLLKAIACEVGVQTPMASGFISQYGLGSASSVQAALKALLAKEMIYEENGGYFLYDVFFSNWIRKYFHRFS